MAQDARSTILSFLLFTAIFIFWIVTYMSSLPNELDGVTALEIRHICNNLSDSVICDPQSLLNNNEKSKIQYSINQMESDFQVKYNSASTTASSRTGTDNNQAKVQMAIVLMKEMTQPGMPLFFINEDKCNYIADRLHDSWDVSGQKIILFLSRREFSSCITCSVGLQKILTPARISTILERIEESNWEWNDEDLYEEIMFSVNQISFFLNVGGPTFLEKYGWYILFGLYIFFYCFKPLSRHWLGNKEEDANTYRELSEEERGEAASLMKKYQCYSCPICLEDYVDASSDGDGSNGNSDYKSITTSNFVGSDRAPIHLLRCGHSSCQRCWDEWTSIAKYSSSCPVCKLDIEG